MVPPTTFIFRCMMIKMRKVTKYSNENKFDIDNWINMIFQGYTSAPQLSRLSSNNYLIHKTLSDNTKRHQFPMFILPLLTSTMEMLLCISNYVCYFGVSLSGVIAWRMVKMENLTILNKMLLIYFSLDFVFGTIETYLLSKLHRERLHKN